MTVALPHALVAGAWLAGAQPHELGTFRQCLQKQRLIRTLIDGPGGQTPPTRGAILVREAFSTLTTCLVTLEAQAAGLEAVLGVSGARDTFDEPTNKR